MRQLSGVLTACLAFVLSVSIVEATEDKDGSAGQTRIDDVRLLPSFGIPYSSPTTSGRLFTGTIEIERFEADQGELKAIGAVITATRRQVFTEFPVTVLQATWDNLELAIGPPTKMPQVDSPMLLFQNVAGSQLRQDEFCDISGANQEGDVEEVAVLLNQGDLFPSLACSWWQAIECAFVISYCRTICSIGGTLNPLCVECVTENGPDKCLGCL